MPARDVHKPVWIDRLFVASAIFFCLTTLLAAWLAGRESYRPEDDRIADLTINLNGIPVREHCTSCHPQGRLSMAGPADDRAMPPHPDIAPHSFEFYGCTACHLGEGMAVDPVVSHGLPGYGARELLTGRDIEARCYTCHDLRPLPGAETAWEGYQLFLATGCDSCHFVDGVGLSGRYGPDLGTVGSYLGLSKLQQSIRYPRKEPENSIMPRFPLSEGQARRISYFLKSRIENPAHLTPMMQKVKSEKQPALRPVTSLSGSELLKKLKCLACHKFGEADGRIAPDLSFISAMRDAPYLEDFLRNPQIRISGAIMPVILMEEEESVKLTTFLNHEARLGVGKRDDKTLYMIFCLRCHAADGNGRGLIQPNLAGLPRPFRDNENFFRRISTERILRSINKGIPGTSMPPYGALLSPEEIDGLIRLIFASFIGIAPDDKTPLPPLPDKTAAIPPPEELRDLYLENCSRCHGRSGSGTGPDYLDYLPRPRNLTNSLFFAAIDDSRIMRSIHDGVPGSAMPAFGDTLADDELWGLVATVRKFAIGHER